MNAADTAKNLPKIKAMLPIMEAFAKGEEVEYNDYDLGWLPCRNPAWNIEVKYRIKPKPVVFYAAVDYRDLPVLRNGMFLNASVASEAVDKWNEAKLFGSPFRVVKVASVVED